MPYVGRMLCLAASRKKGAYCFAGKNPQSRAWIRPVTSHGEHEVSALEATNTAGELTKVGDVLDIAYVMHQPFHFQTENHLIVENQRWNKVGEATWAAVQELLDEPPTLWELGSNSWGYGSNRVLEPLANLHNRSLFLIRPSRLSVSIGRKGGDYANANKRLVKAHFRYRGADYTLQVTDPIIEARMLAGADRTEEIPDAALCVSLGGAFHGYAYKLVAAVITPF